MPDLRTRALQLLARRERSRADLKQRLAAHAESEEQLERLLEALEAEQLLSDDRFAAQRVCARAGRFGDRALRHDLELHGVPSDTVAGALSASGDEAERCRAVWVRKFGAVPQTPAERARHIRFLQTRGFSADSIRQVLRPSDD